MKLFTPFLMMCVVQCLAQGNEKLVAGYQDICWAADSRSLFFSAMWHKQNYSDYKPEKWSVYKFDLKTKQVAIFLDSALTVSATRGNDVAVGKIRNGNRDILVVTKKGHKRKITSHPAEDNWVSFSPDGKQIAFNSRRDGKHEIYIVNSDSSGLKRLTHSNGAAAYSPQWSADGKKIVYYLEKGDSKDQIYVMNADGSNQVNITKDTLHNYYPSWMKDRVLFTNDLKNGLQKIFTCKPDGSDRKQLLDIKTFYARSSPKANMIAYVDNKEQCIKVISMRGELLEKIFLPK